jgi:hypothetical protein
MTNGISQPSRSLHRRHERAAGININESECSRSAPGVWLSQVVAGLCRRSYAS